MAPPAPVIPPPSPVPITPKVEDLTGQNTVSFGGLGKISQVWDGIKQVYSDKIGDPAWEWVKEVGTGQRHKVQDGTLAGNLGRGLVSNYGLPEDYVM